MSAKSAGLVRRIISAVRVISHRVWQVFLDYWWYLRHALPFPNWLRHVLQTKIKRSGSTSHDSFFSGIFSAISQNGPHLHNSLQDYSRRTNNFAGIDNLSAANRRRIQPQRLLIVFYLEYTRESLIFANCGGICTIMKLLRLGSFAGWICLLPSLQKS
ncbi:hypothetical protein RQN30_04400 [Arcanobacterium hippocoleae]